MKSDPTPETIWYVKQNARPIIETIDPNTLRIELFIGRNMVNADVNRARFYATVRQVGGYYETCVTLPSIAGA